MINLSVLSLSYNFFFITENTYLNLIIIYSLSAIINIFKQLIS